ncbi:MAG: hypothetical protein ACP5IA_03150 [Sediminispirochaetaceae bacterium]
MHEPQETVLQEEPPPAPPNPSVNTAAAAENGYEMDEQQYEKTKKDLSVLVDELNRIIASQDYEEWLEYLTTDYITYYSDPDVLNELSQSPLMTKYNIKLRSLKDYFDYVVVGSRKDVHIDDINAISDRKVKVYMIVNDEPIVVYTLEKVDGRWKITK